MKSSIVFHDLQVENFEKELRSLGACGLGAFSDGESDD
jgi:predicted alpha/beta-fold hydrolase